MALTTRDYTKARTIAELRRRAAKGKVVRFDDLPKPLRRAVQRHWQTMAGARRAAGLPELVPGRRRWTRAAILTEIRKLARAGSHMSQNAVTGARSQYRHGMTTASSRRFVVDTSRKKRSQ